MMEDIGLEFNSAGSPLQDMTLRSRSQTFHIKDKMFAFKFTGHRQTFHIEVKMFAFKFI